MEIPRTWLIAFLKRRGYTELRTKRGIQPLEYCEYRRLKAVYLKGKIIKKEVNRK